MRQFARPEVVVFLSLESSEHPMHFSVLQLFRPPQGSGPEFARDTFEAMRAYRKVTPTYAGHPARTRRGTSRLRWTYDDDVDIDYHLRYRSLPTPGGTRELFALADDLHNRLLDRHKPLWECHLIDGLDDGRFALFFKVHHALMDGVSWSNQMQQSLSTDPHDNQTRVGWAPQPELRRVAVPARTRREGSAGMAKSVAKLRRSLSLMSAAMHEPQLVPAFRAPRTIFNVGSGGPLRRAAQSWPLHRIKKVASAAAVSFNDVALAMSAGALRAYLAERNALPDVPLVAMVPVSLRDEKDVDANNILGCALCNLATDLDDPGKRLATIHASMQYNTRIIRELPRQVAIHLGGLICAPISGSTGLRAKIPPMFNVYITHVRGNDEPLYRNGARAEATYGWAPTLPGQALMFGLYSNADNLDFGITGGALVVPDPARMLGQLETSLKDLERAVGL
jgi:diacylglycerol O-acyltransferase / wax synthase